MAEPPSEPLPYGGDLQAAMRAHDRDAIRRLLEARTVQPPRHHPLQQDLEEVLCPICRELLYKPTVNACGHTFCFWCLHRSMDPLSSSSCPICRAAFLHLPAPCLTLHLHLSARFGSEYARRAEDTLASEKEWETSSPRLPLKGEPDWSCVVCRRDRAERARVSVCGHLSCADCFDGTKPCAACAARQAYEPQPCRLICTIHGEQARAGVLPSLAATPPASEISASHVAHPSSPLALTAGVDDACPTSSASAEQAMVDTASSNPYVHFFVGCDGCGVYPISGRAWQCQDCPEAIGYDLCDACHENSRSAGRFGQSHLPSHKMKEREEVQTVWHTLQAANPDMSLREIVQLVEVARAAQQRQMVPQPFRRQPAVVPPDAAPTASDPAVNGSGRNEADGTPNTHPVDGRDD